MPALFTSTETGPNESSAACTADCHWSGSVTSSRSKGALSPSYV
jgi:hypothetical protein